MKRNGFTLIELLLVLAIIGIISAIAVPVFLGSKGKSAKTGWVGVSTTKFLREMGPPDKVEKVADVTFVYYKQPDGTFKVYTLGRITVEKESFK